MWILTKIGFYSITKKPSHLNPEGPAVFNIRGRDKDDLKPFVFLLFFFAAFFVPAWPLLLLVGILYLVAWMAPKGGDLDGGGEPPAEPHPTSPSGRWTNFTRTMQRTTKPFRKASPRFK